VLLSKRDKGRDVRRPTAGGPVGAEVAVGWVAFEGAAWSLDLALETEAERLACGLAGLGPLRFLLKPMSWNGSRSCCHIVSDFTSCLYSGFTRIDLSTLYDQCTGPE